MLEIQGKYTTAKIMIDNIDEKSHDQITNMVNHEAFENSIKIMPDVHYGKGSVIGFTMPLGSKIVPNVVGVDISCGMLSSNIGKIKLNKSELDSKIREIVPFGINVRKTPFINFERNIKWETIGEKKWTFQWFLNLCERVKIDPFYAQQSVGSLGGGKMIASRP